MNLQSNQIKNEIENLTSLNKSLKDFVYRVSHDLQSPLNAIKGLVSFIELEGESENTSEYLGMIKICLDRLDESIKNNLQYSKNNFLDLDLTEISLRKTFKDATDVFFSRIRSSGIKLQIDIDQKAPFFSDKFRLNSLLVNLIDNAIKYQKKDEVNKSIIIKGVSDDEKFRFIISDNGIGISPMYHDRIFEMFFRLSGLAEGYGVGLYIVKETIETLQGLIEVKSDGMNGTTIVVELKNFKR